jgi:CRP-like cAMP-binding protein
MKKLIVKINVSILSRCRRTWYNVGGRLKPSLLTHHQKEDDMTIHEAFMIIEVTAQASADSRTLLEQGAIVKRYKKGEHIFFDKDDGATLFGVIKGTVAIYKLSTTGDKRGIFIFGVGALLNEDSMNGNRISINAEALRDSDILCVKMKVFEAACVKDAKLSKALIDSISLKVRRLYHLMKNTSNNLRGDRRIAAKLWKLSRDHGVQTIEGVEINFDLTITMFAEFLGSQRETVSRQVKTLTDAGLLIVKKSRFIIPSREKLLEFFEE